MKYYLLPIFVVLFSFLGMQERLTKEEIAYNITDITAEIFVELSIDRDSINHAYHDRVVHTDEFYGRVVTYPSNTIFNVVRFDARRLPTFFEDVTVESNWEEFFDERNLPFYIKKYNVDGTYFIILMYDNNVKELMIATITIEEYRYMEKTGT